MKLHDITGNQPNLILLRRRAKSSSLFAQQKRSRKNLSNANKTGASTLCLQFCDRHISNMSALSNSVTLGDRHVITH
ncbi:hypothetical protein T01_1750 [Trichinella spiralis]|uniref:Uncharacterized protein n=1 Tax=Trichinella spiralis TaxID=6334 RepID=A0A0V1AXI8_TRISP|nr:hypothetical protein T01_1750 [Trichinella spiralis]